jgi:sugar phosphate isomerase/epimerase
VPGYPAPARPLTHEGLLERAAALGADVVQIADNMPLSALSDAELDGLVALARQRGIGIETGTRGVDAETLERELAIAARVGSPILRTLLDGAGLCPSPDEAVAMLKDAAPAFERARVTLAIENHDRFKAIALREIVERVGSERVGICIDTANSLGCGEGIEHVLDALADFAVNLHVKDFVVRRLAHNKGFIVEGAPAGRGLLDIPAILERAPREVSAIVELWPPPEKDIETSMAKEEAWAEESVRYLRTFAPFARQPG